MIEPRNDTPSGPPIRQPTAGKIHEDGEFGDVGATACAWLGAKHPGKGAPGRPIVER